MGRLILLEKKRRAKKIRRLIKRKLLPTLIVLGILGLQIYLLLTLKNLI